MEKDHESISSELAKSDIIYLTLNAMRYIPNDQITYPITLISKLVFSAEHSKQFAQHFVNGSGLQMIGKHKLLSPDNSVSFIIDTLSLISQLARISKEFYEPIHNANIYLDLKTLIVH